MTRTMKDSGIEWIGEIPEDWEIHRNKVVFSCNKEIVGENSNNIQLLSLTTGGVKTKDINSVGGKLPESFDTYQYVAIDNIVMCLFDLDISAVFSGISNYNGMISPAYKVLKCNNNYIIPKYADYWFSFVFVDRKFTSYAKNLRYTLSYDEFGAVINRISHERVDYYSPHFPCTSALFLSVLLFADHSMPCGLWIPRASDPSLS